jgi:C4-dicarboxylate transporter
MSEQSEKMMNIKNYRFMDYLAKGFVVAIGMAMLLGLVLFPILIALGVLH